MRITRKHWIVTGIVIVVLVSTIPAALDKYRCSRTYLNAIGPSAAIRAATFDRIARQQYQPGLSAVLRALPEEQNREVLERAGYAAARLEATEAIPLLRKRVDSGPDDSARAALVTYVARASGRDQTLADWFRAGLTSDQPWRRVGSAAGLLDLGQADGGEVLIAIMKEDELRCRAFAYGELRLVASPLTEAIGRPLNWADSADDFMASPDWTRLQEIWRAHVKSRIVMDVLNRPDRTDDRWHEIGRVLRGRQHLGYWLGLTAKPS